MLIHKCTEMNLARVLLRLPEVLLEVAQDLYPNRLCEYIFELSQRFNQFYENCPVNSAADPQVQLMPVVPLMLLVYYVL